MFWLSSISISKWIGVNFLTKDMFFLLSQNCLFCFVFFYQPWFLVIMSTLLMVISTRKGFEASQWFGPIQNRPHKAVWWPVIVWSKKWAKKSFRVTESKSHDLTSPLKQIIWSFKYVKITLLLFFLLILLFYLFF